jgi:mannose-1-phosphate guanylyltransferase/mannose-6-phosphate isomerase
VTSSIEPVLIPVLLSGGSGTRLWPLSREARPKQFLPLLSSRSLFQQALLRTPNLDVGVRPPIVICSEAHREWAAQQSRAVGVEPAVIALEPASRNTAPAVTVAAMLASRRGRRRVRRRRHSGRSAAPRAARRSLDRRCRGAQQGSWAVLDRFVEKPDLVTAESYLRSGEYWWNSGMFLFSAATLFEKLRVLAPEVVRACEQAVAGIAREDGVSRSARLFSPARLSRSTMP